MEKYKSLILFVAAVLVASFTALLAYNWMKSKSFTEEGSIKTQEVAVSTTYLPMGTVLKKPMVKTIPFLKGSLPETEVFTDASLLNGRVLISPVNANEPILKSRLAPDSVSGGGVAAIVDPNKRAMAVKIDKVSGVSGFIHPGNRVDVLVSLNKLDKKRTPVTKIVLQNILVIATGTEIQQKDKEKATSVEVITLELTPDESERLALATSQGKIQLALRNYANAEEVASKGVTIDRLLYGMPVEKNKKIKYVRRTPKATIVQLIKGSTVSEIKF
jgi:pilus assembly protein CpaB